MRMRSVLVLSLIAVAMAGCKDSAEKYIARSRMTEAELQLNKLGKNAKRVYAETSSYVVGTAAQLPAKPRASGCCGGTNNHCAAAPAGFAGDATWRALDFQIDEDSLFYYDYTGTATEFTARATADLDCDGTEVTYELRGTVENGIPQVTLRTPPPDAD